MKEKSERPLLRRGPLRVRPPAPLGNGVPRPGQSRPHFGTAGLRRRIGNETGHSTPDAKKPSTEVKGFEWVILLPRSQAPSPSQLGLRSSLLVRGVKPLILETPSGFAIIEVVLVRLALEHLAIVGVEDVFVLVHFHRLP